MMKIGVFDSGIGGEAVAGQLRIAFPKAIIITVNDFKNVPYGDKTATNVITLTDMAIQPLLMERCDIIVIACNTATAIAIDFLRSQYTTQKFIGIEPMVKTARRLTQSNVVAVCATRATLQSERYQKLIKEFGSQLTIIEPDCSKWASMIQDNEINEKHISETIEPAILKGADVIVLGCTHYHWVKEFIQSVATKRAQVIEPSEAIARRVAQLLKVPLPPR